MKKIIKPNTPNILTLYANAYPNNTWENFRDSGWEEKAYSSSAYTEQISAFKHEAQDLSPYKYIQEQIFNIQGGLCAYCEQDFSCTYGDKHYIDKMIEHFHPKRDYSTIKNWALDWNNLLGCCNGGTQSDKGTFPLPENLSCDQSKEIVLKNINHIEGRLINPIDMPAFPCLFKVDRIRNIGELLPNSDNCKGFSFPKNKNDFNTTEELVENTIKVLNLNCNRLKRKRQEHIEIYTRLIEKARKENNTNILTQLCERFLGRKDNRYHAFFTTYRILLSDSAEKYLKENNFSG